MAKGKARDKSKEAYWRKTMEAFRRSGLQIRQFCRREKLRETAFYFWRREIAQRNALTKPPATAAPRRRKILFVPVRVTPSRRVGTKLQPSGRIEIVLSGSRRVHVAPPVNRQALADVLAVLEAPPC